MKDYQERWKPGRGNSVIASLMGLDELHTKPPFHEKRRGLSESYVRNSASIGLRPGSLLSVARMCRVDNEGVQASNMSENDNVSDRFLNSRSGSFRKGIRYSIGNNDEQKLEHDLLHLGELGMDSMGNSLNSQLEVIDNTRRLSTSIGAFKPGSEKEGTVGYDLKDGELDVHTSVIGNLRHELTHEELPVSSGHSCSACSRAMNRISQQETRRSKFEGLLRYGSYGHHPHRLLQRSSLSNESKKQKLQRWKKMEKKVQGFGDSRRNETLNQILALADRISKQGNLDVKPGKTNLCNPTSSSSSLLSSVDVGDDESLKSLPVSEFEEVKDILSTGWNTTQDELIATENKSEEQTTSQNDDLESKSGRGSKQFQISLGADDTMSPGSKISESSSCSFFCFGSALNNPEAYILGIRDEMDNNFENNFGEDDEHSTTVGVSSITSGDPQSESNLCTKLEEAGKSSAVEEVFSREASLNEYFEEEPAYSNFPAIVPPESRENLKRTNQHSPDSVLESFGIKSSLEWFDGTGLQLQLESLNFDSGETYSEGSVMVVSGDEDAEEEFGVPHHDSRKVKRWLRDGESRNFSYTVDVLDEAGFCGMNSYMDLKMWYSLECPISPLVFETLEKKYGKQTSWQKSERQLLFDRINSALLEIFQAGTTSIQRRLRASFRLDEVVDEIWTTLVSQEKEKTKELSEKALVKWLEFEEGIDIICKELEASLFDELAMEFASLWN
ncbi:uncharacterized protein LOC131009405 [Salvia miltiorrhiza]|uniref:uncharacterized protein LOC131009405 n=1 Tax=Salvia miltiorrhiza TaxID=226208 RepID=UPI0025ACDE35|nr:uncharacterized protein LOC131009405 [Salvia miltiorrhiza]XP_057792701.1 uncharacterized protein LOC131009405 [Salvia miltiorrhiza]